MIHAELCSKYLTDRGIDPEVAKKYGVEFVDGDQIASRMNRWDGLKMVSAIVIGDVLRPLRCPVRLPEGEYLPVPDDEKFRDGWRFKANQDFAEAEEGLYEWTDLTGKAGLVRKKKDGTLHQEPLYPVKAPANATVEKFVAKKGEKRSLYIPEPVVGGRPLLIVEGSTRVLAVLSHLEGEVLDVVGLPSCRISEENTEVLLELAKKATTIYVVLDGDVVTNPDVTRALGNIVYRLDPPKTKDNEDEGGPRDIRIGIPQLPDVASGKAVVNKVGLDDFLAAHPDGLKWFLNDCLPWNPEAAVRQLISDERSDQWARESGEIPLHVARVPGSALLGARWSLARFEGYRMRLVGAGVETPEHPEPEGKLNKPNAEDIATIAGTYVAPHVGHIRVNDEWAKVGPTGLCKIVRNVDFAAVMDRRLAKLMAAEPTRQQHGECLHKVQLTADATDVDVIRRVGETGLAWAELPEPKLGPFPAWKEFLDRCSDAKVVLAWLHTLTIDEYQGRQSLYLRGAGNDGKSTIAELLLDVLGSAGTIIDKATGEERFAWANIREFTRLVVLDDVKNPNLLYARRVRQLCSGGHFEVERKGVDPVAVNLRSRVLICSNIQLKYASDAEKTRVLQVDVENGTKLSDPTWKPKLLAELPAILYVAKICFDDLAQGHTIVPKSDASAAVAEQGALAVEEEFEVLLSQLSFGPDKFVPIATLKDTAQSCKIDGYKWDDLKRWLITNKGCKWGVQHRFWVGGKETSNKKSVQGVTLVGSLMVKVGAGDG